jgi:hypothetical protein
MSSITSTNAVYLLTILRLFPVPQQVQGFSADDIFDTGDVAPAEVMMGLDGKLSGGFVPVPIVQGITLMADSPSNTLFEAWYTAQQAARELYFANAVIQLPAVGTSYVLTNGVLTGYKPSADAKKVLQPRKFSITWESCVPTPLG